MPGADESVFGNRKIKIESGETGFMVDFWASCDTTGQEVIFNFLGRACISDVAIANEALLFKRLTSLEVGPRITGPVLVKVIPRKTSLIAERSTKAGIHERNNAGSLGFIPRWDPFRRVRDRPFPLFGMFVFFDYVTYRIRGRGI